MTAIATGYVALRADVDDLKKDLGKAQNQLERSTKMMQGQAVKTGKSFKAMWLAYAAGAAVVAAGTMKAIKAASDLEETASKFNVVFKGQEKIAEGWAKTLVDSYAMSTREAKFNLAAVQDLLVPMGMASDQAGKLSMEIVKLSADLGSFNNLPTEQVMLDIQSALVGNFETMKKYGVVLNATVVSQKALEMGLAKTKAELTAGMKAQAAYELMMEGSEAATGDMERTSESYANTLKQMQATWEDLMASMGELILPVATKIVGALSKIMKSFNDLIEDVKAAKGFADKTEEWAMQAQIRVGEGMADAFEVGGSKEVPIDDSATTAPAPISAADAKAAAAKVEAAQEAIEAVALADAEGKAGLRQAQIDHDIAMAAFREDNKALILGAGADDNAEELLVLAEHMEKKKALEEDYTAQVSAIRSKANQMYMQAAATGLNAIYELTGRKHKALFILIKGFEVARAVVNAFAASSQALANPPGPPFTIPLSNAVLAVGLANAASIGAAAIGSSGGGGAAMAGGGPGFGSIESKPVAEVGGDAEDRGQVNIYIQGDMIADELYLEMLAEKLSQAVEGNEVTLISSEVRAT